MVESRNGKVLVVDGDRTTRESVADALRRAGYDVDTLANADAALSAVAAETQPALVLIELQLEDMTGYELCRELRDAYGDGLAIFLMSGDRTKSMDRVAALMIGADDYIVKPIELDELVARTRRFVQRRSRNGGPTAVQATPRELAVLTLLADGNDQQQIAAELGISPKTVATHIQHLLGKFGAHSRAQLVALAYKQGFVNGR
jgi:DNA-binding NarL/FixJ family response regulator